MENETQIKIKTDIRNLLAKWKYEIDAKDYSEVVERVLGSGMISPNDLLTFENNSLRTKETQKHINKLKKELKK